MTLLQNLAKHSLAYLHCAAFSLFLSLSVPTTQSKLERLRFSLIGGLVFFWTPMLCEHIFSCKRLTSCTRKETCDNSDKYDKYEKEQKVKVPPPSPEFTPLKQNIDLEEKFEPQ
jgi:hypothetical protein